MYTLELVEVISISDWMKCVSDFEVVFTTVFKYSD